MSFLQVKKLHPEAITPTVNNPGEDLGYDLYALEDVLLEPGKVTKVPTGISATMLNHGLLIRDRSSMASKGIIVTAGVVDEGYRGEICVLLTNFTFPMQPYQIRKGDKVAQMIPLQVKTYYPVQVVTVLPESGRGVRGFGSSGR